MRRRLVKTAIPVCLTISLIAMLLAAGEFLLPWVVWFVIFLVAAWVLLKELRSLTLVFGMVGGFVYITAVLAAISGTGGAAGPVVVGVNPEAGEALFWDKGKCHTCHSVGNRGSAIRGPNLGDSRYGPIIGVRAAERAREREAQGVDAMSTTQYLIESLAEPSAYIVEGFKDEMPYVFRPPIALEAGELKAVISYLQSLGGEVDVGAIRLPESVRSVRGGTKEVFQSYLTLFSAEEDTVYQGVVPESYGDPLEGEYLFYDATGNASCGRCHTAITLDGSSQGSSVGPELSSIAGTQTLRFILESILAPSDVVASGYGQVRIDTKDGRIYVGIPREEDSSVTLSQQEGSDVVEITVVKSEIERMREISTSMMPGNFAELLTVQELHHILAFLLTQTGDQPLVEDTQTESTPGSG